MIVIIKAWLPHQCAINTFQHNRIQLYTEQSHAQARHPCQRRLCLWNSQLSPSDCQWYSCFKHIMKHIAGTFRLKSWVEKWQSDVICQQLAMTHADLKGL